MSYKFGASYNCWVMPVKSEAYPLELYQEVGSTEEGSALQYVSDDYNALTAHLTDGSVGELTTDHPYMGAEVDSEIGGGTVIAVLVEDDEVYGVIFSDPQVMGPQVIK